MADSDTARVGGTFWGAWRWWVPPAVAVALLAVFLAPSRVAERSLHPLVLGVALAVGGITILLHPPRPMRRLGEVGRGALYLGVVFGAQFALSSAVPADVPSVAQRAGLGAAAALACAGLIGVAYFASEMRAAMRATRVARQEFVQALEGSFEPSEGRSEPD